MDVSKTILCFRVTYKQTLVHLTNPSLTKMPKFLASTNTDTFIGNYNKSLI